MKIINYRLFAGGCNPLCSEKGDNTLSPADRYLFAGGCNPLCGEEGDNTP
jgi:hypothetical protein